MVKNNNTKQDDQWKKLCCYLVCIIYSYSILSNIVDAAVIATIDRPRVELNETFTLKVIVDTAIDVEPEASALEDDFFVGSRSQLSNTTIINGKISRSRTWTYALMAKKPGNLVIPPIVIANEQSEPINILIAPQSDAILGEADIFIAADLDAETTYVQAQNLLRIKIYRTVQTRQPRLYEPEISGVDTLIEIAGDDQNYESVINGKTYDVIERVYALFPQESGLLEIAPIRFEARILKDGGITGRRTYQSKESKSSVLAIPSPPLTHPNADWLPARDVSISEEWSRDLGDLRSGEPITRQINITAVGQLSTQLPSLDYRVNNKLKIYPDKPKFSDRVEAPGIIASRTDQYAMIGMTAGEIQLLGIELPWWDIINREWKIAILPAKKITIKPSLDNLVEEKIIPLAKELESTPSNEVVSDELWKNISVAMAVLWILTILFWFYSKPTKKRKEKNTFEPPYKKLEREMRKVIKAAASSKKEKFKLALYDWSRIKWPEDIPRNIEEIASRVENPLSDELKVFNKIAYGTEQNEIWDGADMVSAIKKISFSKTRGRKKIDQGLPPLAPN
jgi:hypothetical protein|tara:strand:+ start:22566 stop:24263 length:1698 start_codon:yes stop_codon:yes gene_type:complete